MNLHEEMDRLDKKCEELLKNKKIRKLYNQVVKEQEENTLKLFYNKDNKKLIMINNKDNITYTKKILLQNKTKDTQCDIGLNDNSLDESSLFGWS